MKWKKIIHVTDIFEYLLAICLVLNSRSIWQHSYLTASRNRNILFLVTTISLLACIWKNGVIKTKRFSKGFFILIFFILYAGIYTIFRRFNLSGFVKLIIIVSLMIFYYHTRVDDYRYPSLCEKFTNVMSVVALISLIIWTTGSLFHLYPTNCSIIHTWSGDGKTRTANGYFNIQYIVQTASLPFTNIVIDRNTSFFTEGATASYNFAIALLFETMLNKNKRKSIMFFLSAAIVSTLSYTGYIILGFCALYLLLTSKFRDKAIKILKYISIPIAFLVISFLIYKLLLAKKNLSSSLSFAIRMDDFLAGFKCWRSNPIFGYGYMNDNKIKPFMSPFRAYNQGFSNSLMSILANGGVYIFILYLYPVIKAIVNSVKYKDINLLYFTITFLVMFIFTTESYQWISILIFIYIANVYGNDSAKKIMA